MTTQQYLSNPGIWRPQPRFKAVIASKRNLIDFNGGGGIAVTIEVMNAVTPDLEIIGSQSEDLSFWETRSKSGFVTKPKFSAGLITIRFVTKGQISYLRRDGEVSCSSSIAALTGFDDLREVRASHAVEAISATISLNSLARANKALHGDVLPCFPDFEPIADMARPGISALFCTIRIVQSQITQDDQDNSLMLPLLREIVSYQLLSSWPKRHHTTPTASSESGSRHVRLAIDYIEANISRIMTLADVAAAVGTGVRSLQTKFKSELGKTPVQFIIERRLARAHEDLLLAENSRRSVGEIARSWGFVHMSDFGQRYRRAYGCAPTRTRQDADRTRQVTRARA